MATTPSAFFNAAGHGAEVSELAMKNLPKGFTKFKGFFPGKEAPETFKGTSGNDVFYVHEGDKVAFSKGYDAVVTDRDFTIGKALNVGTVQLTGNADLNVTGSKLNNNLFGNDGDNVIRAGGGADVVSGGAGNDKLYGDAGNDKVYGGTGHDTIDGGAGNDKLYGGEGDDKLYGGAGNDLLDGGNDNDILFGGSGNDTLLGGAGNDTLVGDTGSNIMTGGEGNDLFVIEQQTGAMDTITDFHKGEDMIDLSDTYAHGMSDLKIVSDGKGNTIVTVSDGTKFKLLDVNPDALDASCFYFGR